MGGESSGWEVWVYGQGWKVRGDGRGKFGGIWALKVRGKFGGMWAWVKFLESSSCSWNVRGRFEGVE